MSEYLVDIKNERLSFFTPAGEVKALNDVSIHLKEGEVLGEPWNSTDTGLMR